MRHKRIVGHNNMHMILNANHGGLKCSLPIFWFSLDLFNNWTLHQRDLHLNLPQHYYMISTQHEYLQQFSIIKFSVFIILNGHDIKEYNMKLQAIIK
jgi:hypothetical protein